MKNKLTLKSLQEQLENLKSSKTKSKKSIDSTNKAAIGHDIKNSYINKMYLKSSGLLLYLVTAILAYAHKIPFIWKNCIYCCSILW